MAKFKHPSKPEAGTAVPVEALGDVDVLLLGGFAPHVNPDAYTISSVPDAFVSDLTPATLTALLASIIATGIVMREKAGVEGVATRSVDYAEGILAEVKKRSLA